MDRWTYEQVALVVGLRFLGEELPEIARRTGHNPYDIRSALAHVASQTGDTTLYADLPELPVVKQEKRPRSRNPVKRPAPVKTEQTKQKKQPEVFRRWRVNTRSHWPVKTGTVTAYLMGDPSPERSALKQLLR